MKKTDISPYLTEANKIITAHNSTHSRKIGRKTLYRELKEVYPEVSERTARDILKMPGQCENIPVVDRSAQILAPVKVETANKPLETDNLIFTDKKMPEMDVDKWFDMLITKRQLQHDLSCEQNEAIIELKNPLNLPYLIHMPFGDWHIGDAACDVEGFRDLISSLKKCKNFLTIGGTGDYNNMFISFKNAMALHSQNLSPMEQQLFFRAVMVDLLDILAYLAKGNHDQYLEKYGAFDALSVFFGEKTVIIDGMGKVTLRVNGIDYVLAISHKGKGHSDLNKTHANKRMFKEDFPEADIVIRSHTHGADYEVTKFYGREQCHLVMGSLNHNSFSKGFSRWASSEMPCVVIGTQEKFMQPFMTLEKALKFGKHWFG